MNQSKHIFIAPYVAFESEVHFNRFRHHHHHHHYKSDTLLVSGFPLLLDFESNSVRL